jgi:hypothetical protein
MNRRAFLQKSAMTLAAAGYPGLSFASTGLNQEDPHFFLAVTYFGGWDHSYLFDARPLDMTRAGLIQNYSNAAAKVWAPGDSESCLANPLTDPLKQHFSDICIVKGVMMATTFDGHGQNENYIYTGNAFGGDSFIPVINQKGKVATKNIPMDGVLSGGSTITLTNGERMVELSPYDLKTVVEELKRKPINPQSPEYQFFLSRYEQIAGGQGGFSAGAAKLFSAGEKAIELSQRLAKIDPGFSEIENETKAFVAMLSQLFANQVSFSAQFNSYSTFDTHSAFGAKEQPATFAYTVGEIKTLLEFLKSTPFDNQRSLLDVTTVMITSEFSRTMRIDGFPIDDTGTNHNTFNNTVLFAGKGIRGGQVIGGTDYQTAVEQLSAAHLQIDPIKEKIFGRPFDYSLQRATNDKPSEFKLEHYLNFKNLVNTMYSLFEVPQENWWTLERQGPVAPIVSRLLL